MTRKICRCAVALATFVACLTLASSPASAKVEFFTTSTLGGYIHLTGLSGATGLIPLGSVAGAQCSSTSRVHTLTAIPGKRSAAVKLKMTAQNRFTVTTTTQVYVAVVETAGNHGGVLGTFGATGHSTTDLQVTFDVKIYLAGAGGTSCAKGAQVCSYMATHDVGISWTDSLPLTADRHLTVTHLGGGTWENISDGCDEFFVPTNQQLDSVTLRILNKQASSPANHALGLAGGTMTLTGTGGSTLTSTFGGTVGAGCGTTATVSFDPEEETGNVTAFSSTNHFIFGGNHYVSQMSRTSSTEGAIITLPGEIDSLGVSLQMDVFAAANNSSTNSDCGTTGTRRCRLMTTLGFAGSYDDEDDLDGESLALSRTVSVASSSASVTMTFGCISPFIAFHLGTAVITGLTAHVTT